MLAQIWNKTWEKVNRINQLEVYNYYRYSKEGIFLLSILCLYFLRSSSYLFAILSVC